VGDNVRKHPEEFKMIVDRGHRLGNHTFNHIRGFEYRSDNYLANTDKANELIHTNLFRPPHGHMRWMQYMVLRHKYQIVMWDLVTRDYSKRLNGRQVLRKVKHYVPATAPSSPSTTRLKTEKNNEICIAESH